MVRPFRKPLIIFTPKSLLRHPRCISQIQDLSNGSFAEIIDDAGANPLKVKRVLVCSGKLFYDLLEQKEKDQTEHIAIVRLEQLYPLPTDQLQKIKQRYKNADEWIWIQEEPVNMGAWSYLLRVALPIIPFKAIARPESASPATGSYKAHEREQRQLIAKAFE